MTARATVQITSIADRLRFLQVSMTDSTRERNLSPLSERVPRQIFRMITLPWMHRSASLRNVGWKRSCRTDRAANAGSCAHSDDIARRVRRYSSSVVVPSGRWVQSWAVSPGSRQHSADSGRGITGTRLCPVAAWAVPIPDDGRRARHWQ